MAMDEVIEILIRVMDVLENHEIPYFVAGSLASSLHGIPRATQDADVVADIRTEHVDLLVQEFRGSFYIDEAMVRGAIENRSSFNIIHLETLFKVDMFIPKDDLLSRYEMERRQSFQIPGRPDKKLVVASPEDVIVQKLHWHRLGSGVSERQWTDALGVIKVTGKRLDREYLSKTAALLDVQGLLNRALGEAGLEPRQTDPDE